MAHAGLDEPRLNLVKLFLIMGGSSGVGIFGIQIAKLYGCVVIATASPDKTGKAQRNLVQIMPWIIERKDWYKEVKGITKEIAKERWCLAWS